MDDTVQFRHQICTDKSKPSATNLIDIAANMWLLYLFEPKIMVYVWNILLYFYFVIKVMEPTNDYNMHNIFSL